MTAPDDHEHFLQVAIEAARKAGAVIKEAFDKPKDVQEKTAVTDLVTATDQQAEKLIYDHLKQAFPDHLFIGEEGSSAQGFTSDLTDRPTWMCDPLDGTTNFVHSFPFVCVSLALVINRETVVGVVFSPVMDELFTAVKGRGAFLNRRRLSAASAKQSLASALLITEVGTKRDAATLEAMFGRITALTQRCRAVRLCGSCALDLCAVACGRADVMYEVGFGGPWDCAAGALIVQEAGGHVADVVGGPFDVMARRVLAAGSAALLHEAAGVLQACKFSALEPGPPTGQGPPAAGPS